MNIEEQQKFTKFETVGEIGILSINRPDKLNSLSLAVLKEMKMLLKELVQDKEYKLRGLIFTGEGTKSFIAGADVEEMSKMHEKEAYDFALLGQHVTLLIERLNIPVIAAVQGYALGGGLEMALSCDLIFCTRQAVFGFPEVKLGLIPGFGGTQRLAKIIGRQKAKEMIFTGRNFGAEEALKLNLVLAVFENREDMINAAKAKIDEMKKNSPLAISQAKKVMNLGIDLPVAEGLNLELEEFSNVFSSQDMQEGTKAFLEKRPPRFTGK